MVSTFDEIVDIISQMPMSDKEHLLKIINKRIVEEKREEFYKNYLQSKSEKFTFSDDIIKLKKILK